VLTLHGISVAYARLGRIDKAGKLFADNTPLDKALNQPSWLRASDHEPRDSRHEAEGQHHARLKDMMDYLQSPAGKDADTALLNIFGTP
jgi:hypothetical protein